MYDSFNCFRCKIRRVEPFLSCCKESIFGSWSPRFLWLKMRSSSDCNVSCKKCCSWAHLANLLGMQYLLFHLLSETKIQIIISGIRISVWKFSKLCATHHKSDLWTELEIFFLQINRRSLFTKDCTALVTICDVRYLSFFLKDLKVKCKIGIVQNLWNWTLNQAEQWKVLR